MKKKTIKIPIYYAKLTMILDKDLSWVIKKYGLDESCQQYGAMTLRDGSGYRHYVVAFTDPEHLSNLTHEAIHVKNYLFIDCAMQCDRYNDEAEAYLCGWLVDQMYDFLKING